MRTSHAKLALAFLTVLGALAFMATPALAARGHVFCTTCTIAPTGGEAFNDPAGIAVNEATGDVYVVDAGNGRVEYFTAAGVYAGEFTGPSATGIGTLTNGSDTITSAAATTGAFSVGEEISTAGGGLPAGTKIVKIEAGGVLEVSESATASELASLTAHQSFSFPSPEAYTSGIAVDNACHLHKPELTSATTPSCEQFDPSDGDVYVATHSHGNDDAIDKFTAAGEYIGQLTGIPEGPKPEFGSVYGVAVDPSGNVWIVTNGEGNQLDEFTNAADNVFSPRFRYIDVGRLGPGFAVDSDGDFYVNSESGVVKLNSSDEITLGQYQFLYKKAPEPIEAGSASGLAVDQASGGLFLDNVDSVSAVGASGSFEERFGSGHLTSGTGVAVAHPNSSAYSTVYVADSTADVVDLFTPTPPGAPRVKGESVAEVTADSATLGAEVNPDSLPSEKDPTSYRFEYTTEAQFAREGFTGAASAPVPDGELAPSFNAEPVSVHVQGLAPGTGYRFRVVAENAISRTEKKPTEGEARAFTTRGTGAFALPDGRAWEMVSPPDKNGSLIEPIALGGNGSALQAAADGGAITYVTDAPTESGPAGYDNFQQVLSKRGEGGAWETKDIAIPHTSSTSLSIGHGQEYRYFSEDLSQGVVQPFKGFDPLSGEASEQTAYLRDNATGAYTPLVTDKAPYANDTAKPFQPFGGLTAGECYRIICGPEFVGASPDLSHVVLSSPVALTNTTPEATGGGLYEWSVGKPAGEQLQLVSLLPANGAGEELPAGPSEPGLPSGNGGSTDARHAVSADGSRVFWSTGSRGPLYVRDLIKKETLALGGLEATFQIASSEGSRVFYSEGGSLYVCEVTVGAGGELECKTSDLGSVEGTVPGASEDGSYVYFVAGNDMYEDHQAGGVWTKTLVATLAPGTNQSGDSPDWSQEPQTLPARVSPNGEWLAFMSQRSLTGYDNTDAVSGQPDEEVYLYNGQSGKLVCASCNPTGARPHGEEYNKIWTGEGGLVGGFHVWPLTSWLAANIPGWTPYTSNNALYQSRYLSNSGRLFFNSSDALVPKDVNGQEDVYEYEPVGIKNPEGKSQCSEATSSGGQVYETQANGCVGLISSGESASESAFLDASENGSDVFFLTTQKLAPQDFDNALDIYDAHECSTCGSPCPPTPAEAPPPCTTEASCKASPTPQPGIYGPPSSATFSGPGNLAPEPPAKPKPPTAAQLRAKHLKTALATCKKRFPHNKGKRSSCERAAHKRFGPVKKK